MKENGDNQKSLSNKLNIQQSRISKILNGQFSRGGKTLDILMEYSKYNEYIVAHKLTGEIDRAVSEIWDGSPQMELRIANMIRQIGPALASQSFA